MSPVSPQRSLSRGPSSESPVGYPHASLVPTAYISPSMHQLDFRVDNSVSRRSTLDDSPLSQSSVSSPFGFDSATAQRVNSVISPFSFDKSTANRVNSIASPFDFGKRINSVVSPLGFESSMPRRRGDSSSVVSPFEFESATLGRRNLISVGFDTSTTRRSNSNSVVSPFNFDSRLDGDLNSNSTISPFSFDSSRTYDIGQNVSVIPPSFGYDSASPLGDEALASSVELLHRTRISVNGSNLIKSRSEANIRPIVEMSSVF